MSSMDAENSPPVSILVTGLEPEQRELVYRALHESAYARGDLIFISGEPAHNLFLVCKGVIKKSYSNARGDEQILGIFQAGDIFGELFLGKYGHRIGDAIALTDALVASLTKDDLEWLIDLIPRLGINMIQHLADEQRETLARMHAMRQVNARHRLLGVLLTLARRSCPTPDGCMLPPEITQADIANIAGLNRSTASLLINEMRREGILGGSGRVLSINRPLVEHLLEIEGLEILE